SLVMVLFPCLRVFMLDSFACRRRTIGVSIFSITCRTRSPSTFFPYTTLFRSALPGGHRGHQRSDGPAQWGQLQSAVSGQHPVQRSEEHTSELQSRFDLVCRLLLEKKNKT